MVDHPECQQFEAELAFYLEGEYRPWVEEHARRCPFCRAVLADLELIRSTCRDLPDEDPPACVWESIRATMVSERIFAEPVSSWRRWFQGFAEVPNPAPVAALACLALFAAFLLVPPGDFERIVAPAQSNLHEVAGLEMPAPLAEDEALTRTLGEMEKSYQAQVPQLDPSVKAVYDKSLKSLDSSIVECRNSVRQEPSNTLAHEYLFTAYAQKAEVLASALEYEGR